jgi:hypothetical protein
MGYGVKKWNWLILKQLLYWVVNCEFKKRNI